MEIMSDQGQALMHPDILLLKHGLLEVDGVWHCSLGKFDHDLTATEPWNHVFLQFFYRGIIRFYGRTIQVNE